MSEVEVDDGLDIQEFEDSEDLGLPCSSDKERGIGVEIVDDDEFKFLDEASELAALQSELYEVRGQLAQKKSNGEYIPLKLYRSHCHNSLSVTDIQTGLWCERKLEYDYLYPHMKKTRQWKREEAVKAEEIKKKTTAMVKGANIHLMKELEVHVPVIVKTITPEDKWALRLLTTYTQLSTVKEGKLEREISVFGDPFNTGILLNGIIDQLQYCTDTQELIVTDLKTRRSNTMPGPSQLRGHKLQVMIYKLLLDELTRGRTDTPSLFTEHLKLNTSAVLTRGITNHICEIGMRSVFITLTSGDAILCEEDLDPKITFGNFVQTVTTLIRGLDLPPVGALTIYYEFQETGEVLGVENVVFEESWVRETLESALKFWRGQRDPTGPDVEDLEWKCGNCQFRGICVWRRQKMLESSPCAKSPSKSLHVPSTKTAAATEPVEQ